jgi:hypothetical protein
MDDNIHADGNYQIFISNACKENLEMLVNCLGGLKRQSQEGLKRTDNTNEQGDVAAVVDKPRYRKVKPEPIKEEGS